MSESPTEAAVEPLENDGVHEPDLEPAEGAEGPEDAADGSRASRDAAKYRTQLRDSQAALEKITGRLEKAQRRDVERLAGDKLQQPGDLFEYGGVRLEDVTDDDGLVDETLVARAVAAMLVERPGLAKVQPRLPLDLGGGRRDGIPSQTSWSVALGQGNRRR